MRIGTVWNHRIAAYYAKCIHEGEKQTVSPDRYERHVKHFEKLIHNGHVAHCLSILSLSTKKLSIIPRLVLLWSQQFPAVALPLESQLEFPHPEDSP